MCSFAINLNENFNSRISGLIFEFLSLKGLAFGGFLWEKMFETRIFLVISLLSFVFSPYNSFLKQFWGPKKESKPQTLNPRPRISGGVISAKGSLWRCFVCWRKSLEVFSCLTGASGGVFYPEGRLWRCFLALRELLEVVFWPFTTSRGQNGARFGGIISYIHK